MPVLRTKKASIIRLTCSPNFLHTALEERQRPSAQSILRTDISNQRKKHSPIAENTQDLKADTKLPGQVCQQFCVQNKPKICLLFKQKKNSKRICYLFHAKIMYSINRKTARCSGKVTGLRVRWAQAQIWVPPLTSSSTLVG